jgi:glyoxylase-like metal-dependent hydrolase (beta-lactamase superfamily II)
MRARIQRVVTRGTFSLDGGTWNVENNVWLVGDDESVLVIDASHDPRPIINAIGYRRVVAIACTHAHDDHVTAAPALGLITGAPILVHPADQPLWKESLPDAALPAGLGAGQRLMVAGTILEVLHTPGHTPGSVCFYLPSMETVFTGDTLFRGGPGATGRSYSDFPTIIASIRDQLLSLPGTTRVHTGHGPDTSVGSESLSLRDWVSRGY